MHIHLCTMNRGRAKLGSMIHKDTAALLHKLLKMLAEEGEDKTFAYIRKNGIKKRILMPESLF